MDSKRRFLAAVQGLRGGEHGGGLVDSAPRQPQRAGAVQEKFERRRHVAEAGRTAEDQAAALRSDPHEWRTAALRSGTGGIRALGGGGDRRHRAQPRLHARRPSRRRGTLAGPARRCCLGANNTKPEFRASLSPVGNRADIGVGCCAGATDYLQPGIRLYRGARLTALRAVASVGCSYVALPCSICRCCLPDRLCQRPSRAGNERCAPGNRRRHQRPAHTACDVAGLVRGAGGHRARAKRISRRRSTCGPAWLLSRPSATRRRRSTPRSMPMPSMSRRPSRSSTHPTAARPAASGQALSWSR